MEQAVDRIVRCFETLRREDLPSLGEVYADDARFKDPFNEVQGLAAITAVFAHMFDTLDEPRFIFRDRIVQGRDVFLSWDFRFRLRRWQRSELCVRGGSQLRLDAQGRICEHRDYWDVAEELYEKLPLLGSLMRWLRRRAGG